MSLLTKFFYEILRIEHILFYFIIILITKTNKKNTIKVGDRRVKKQKKVDRTPERESRKTAIETLKLHKQGFMASSPFQVWFDPLTLILYYYYFITCSNNSSINPFLIDFYLFSCSIYTPKH